jgi:hypothetical protein
MSDSLRLTKAAHKLRTPYHVLYRGVLSGELPAHKEPPSKGWWVKVCDLPMIAQWVQTEVRSREPRPAAHIIEQVRTISLVQGQLGLSLRGLAKLLCLPQATLQHYVMGTRPAPPAVIEDIKKMTPRIDSLSKA